MLYWVRGDCVARLLAFLCVFEDMSLRMAAPGPLVPSRRGLPICESRARKWLSPLAALRLPGLAGKERGATFGSSRIAPICCSRPLAPCHAGLVSSGMARPSVCLERRPNDESRSGIKVCCCGRCLNPRGGSLCGCGRHCAFSSLTGFLCEGAR